MVKDGAIPKAIVMLGRKASSESVQALQGWRAKNGAQLAEPPKKEPFGRLSS